MKKSSCTPNQLELNFQWEFIIDKEYKLSTCGRLYNKKNNRFIKRTLVSLSEGFWINRKFYPLSKIKKNNLFVPVTKQIEFTLPF